LATGVKKIAQYREKNKMYLVSHLLLRRQEAKNRRIAVQSQPGQIVHETLS
jgi:hypothetical protein